MKKWVAFFAALALTVCAGLAAAEKEDLSNYNDDEILALMLQIQQEVVDRGIGATATLSAGTYTVGKDLPAGSYTYTCLATGYDWGNVTVYSKNGDGDLLLWEVVSEAEDGEQPETFKVTLNENDQLESGVPFSLTIYTGIVFK